MSLSKKFLCTKWLQRYGKRFIQTTTNTLSNRHDEPIDEQFHFLPMGQSDVGLQTRFSFLSKDMSGTTELVSCFELFLFKVGIKTISPSGFRLYDNSFMFGPIAVFPTTVLSWRVSRVEDIVPESLELFFTLQPKLDVLILGVGDLKNVDQDHAMSTFNFLNAERRYMAAALFPPQDLAINDYQFGKVLTQLEDYSKAEENPLLFGASHIGGDGVEDAVRQIWGTGKEAKQIEQTVRLLKEEQNREKDKYFEERRQKRMAKEEEEQLQIEEKNKK